MSNIMDPEYNGMAASELYRSQVFPELFPHQKQMLVRNWSVDDIQMYVIPGSNYADWEIDLLKAGL